MFVSADGATEGMAGAQRFAERYADRQKVEAALVLDDLGAAVPQRPYVVPWSTGLEPRVAGRRADGRRGAARETGSAAGIGVVARPGRAPGVAADAARAGPAGARGHRRGHAHGARASCRAAPAPTRSTGISEDRLTRFGRAAFASVLAFDSPGYRGKPPVRATVIGPQRAFPAGRLRCSPSA